MLSLALLSTVLVHSVSLLAKSTHLFALHLLKLTSNLLFCFLSLYSQFSLFTILVFYEVALPTELINTEPLFQGNKGLGPWEPYQLNNTEPYITCTSV